MVLYHKLEKVVSGGQTGVDQGGLNAAIYLGIPHGGWCPKGRRSEAGPIPKRYAVTEVSSWNYVVRTEKNIVDSDGTLILYMDQLTGGTKLTYQLAKKHARPNLALDLTPLNESEDIDAAHLTLEKMRFQVQNFLNQYTIRVLNVAGPRESTHQGICQQAESFLIYSLRSSDDIE